MATRTAASAIAASDMTPTQTQMIKELARLATGYQGEYKSDRQNAVLRRVIDLREVLVSPSAGWNDVTPYAPVQA